MKNTTKLAAAILLILFGASSAMAAEYAPTPAKGTVQFNGQIKAATCTVVAPTVALGTFDRSVVEAGNAAETPFTVQVNNCQAVDVATVAFTATNSTVNNNIENAGNAANTAIEITKTFDDNAKVDFDSGLTIANGVGNFTFNAKPVKDKGAVGLGTISATMDVTVTYN